MKLIEIVKSLPWPDGAVCVVQDCTVYGDGLLKYCSTDDVAPIRYIDEKRSKSWATNERPVSFAQSVLADDHYEAVVTHAEWLAAQEPEDPKEREPGFYWVLGTADWFVAEWNGEIWSAPFNDNQFDDAGVFQIDERRIVRQP